MLRSRARLSPRFGRPAKSLLAAAFVVALGAGAPRAAHAQIVRSDLWATDANVTGIVTSATTAYICGSFTHVGPPTGSCAPLDATTAKATAFPGAVGRVWAAVPDGTGGWFVAGATTYNGVSRPGLAHLAADYSLLPWNPGPIDGSVRSLAVKNNVLYAGGLFNNVNGQPRAHLVALDATTAAVL